MKLTKLLEGTIKVPEDTYKQLMVAICADVFSRIASYLDSPKGEEYFDNLLTYKKIVAQYKAKYGDFDVFKNFPEDHQTSHKIYMRMGEVDRRYLSRNPNAKTAIYTILATIKQGANDNPSGGYHKKKAGVAAQIFIEVPKQQTIELIARSPELIEPLFDRLEGVAEHELMHAIQDMAFKGLPDNLDYYDSDNNLIDAKYYSHDIEFSPIITSSAKEFIAYLKDIKAMGRELSKDDKVALFKNFTDPSAPPVRGMASVVNNFFYHLYQNKPKWKKAVKYFYGLVRDSLQ